VNRPLRFGIVGIHGFARAHIASLTKLREGGAPVQLAVAVCRRTLGEQDKEYVAGLESHGTRLLPDYGSLLKLRDEIDVISLPVSIHAHVPMATAALEAGFHVYLEKPVAGAIQDARRLVPVADKASGRLFIGYNDGYQPAHWGLKRFLLSRELGAVRKIVVVAAWPRYENYYTRNKWAGALMREGVYILDSPINNACAHYINLALFWAGSAVAGVAAPVAVTAELYRVYPIESADTTCARVTTAEGVEIVFLASHACRRLRGPVFRIECEQGTIGFERGKAGFAPWQIRRAGQAEKTLGDDFKPVDAFENVTAAINGDKERPIYTLEMSLPQTLAANGAFLSSPISTLPAEACAREVPEPNEWIRVAPAMNDLLDACFERGCLPSETGLTSWARRGAAVDVSALQEFCLPQFAAR
jgi:predicted dehydrogenase